MANIIVEKMTVKSHKEHHCEINPFLRGFLSDCDYCPECGEHLVIQKEIINYSVPSVESFYLDTLYLMTINIALTVG